MLVPTDHCALAFVCSIPIISYSSTLSSTSPLLVRKPVSTTRKVQASPTSSLSPGSPSSESDDLYIRRCIELASKAAGQTRPNPPVGCVIVDAAANTILGEGYHRRAGEPHAEVNALRNVKQNGYSSEQLSQATVYVSLEPCNHYGKTPPCSKALVEANVSRVVVGIQDPDSRTSGLGIKRILSHAIPVDVYDKTNVVSKECLKLIEGFKCRIINKRPFGILKYAMTLDGKIASENGSSKWISGTQSRQKVHQLRANVDAIVVGGQTLRKDNPFLTPRNVYLDGDLRPIRVIMTKHVESISIMDRNLWDVSQSQTIVFIQQQQHDIQNNDFLTFLKNKNVQIIFHPQLDPLFVSNYLYDEGCLNVLWECGGNLAAQALNQGVIDKVWAFVAPKIIGGREAPSPVGSPAIQEDMEKALVLQEREVETFENGDILISGYVR